MKRGGEADVVEAQLGYSVGGLACGLFEADFKKHSEDDAEAYFG